MKSTDYIKVHYDHGVCEKEGKKWNLYASVNANKLLKNVLFKAGVAQITDKYNIDNRIRVNVQDEIEYHWYNRTVVNKDKYKFGFLSVVNLGKKVL